MEDGDGEDGDDEVSLFAARLRSIKEPGDLPQCRALHAEILESSFHRNKFLRNLLVVAYGSCGSVESSRLVFDSIDRPNLYSWNILLKVYLHNGLPQQAVELYTRIQSDRGLGLQPNAHTFATVLAACWDLDLGRDLHAKIRDGGYESIPAVGTGLITMYARCGSVDRSKEIFDRFPEYDEIVWTAMVTAYARHGHLDEAREVYERMPKPRTYASNVLIDCLSAGGRVDQAKALFDSLPEPDVVARTSMLAAYARVGHLDEAREIFDDMSEKNVVSWNSIISAYVKAGKIVEARRLFETMPAKDTVSWTTIIAAYAQIGDLSEARKLFEKAKIKDIVLWNTILAAYSNTGAIDQAKDLFDQIPVKDTVSWNTLLAAYALHGHISLAEALLEEIPRPSTISWNTMLTGYAFNDRLSEAEALFDKMASSRNAVSWNILVMAVAESRLAKKAIALLARKDLDGFETDKYTFIAVFDACTGLAVAEDGKAVHMSIVEAGLLFDDALGESLINMYSKCGSLNDARALFHNTSKLSLDVAAWNAFMAACSTAGSGAEALDVFRLLDNHGLEPNPVSFVRVLSACSHAGMIQDARNYFSSIPGDYNSVVTMDHYLCIVDMLGRSGRLNQARELLDSMPFEPDVIAWMTLLSACSSHGDTAGGVDSARRIIRLQPQTSGPFILLSNIYRQLGETGSSVRYYKLAKPSILSSTIFGPACVRI